MDSPKFPYVKPGMRTALLSTVPGSDRQRRRQPTEEICRRSVGTPGDDVASGASGAEVRR